jgi:DNA mismatch repair protein MSH5
MINETIDFTVSAQQHRTAVKFGVDEELDNMKHTYDNMDNLLTTAAMQVSDSLPEYARYMVSNIAFFPQLGFLTAVLLDPNTGRGQYEGDEGEVWELMFSSNDNGYYKNTRMKKMDECFGDMYSMICGKFEVRFSDIFFLPQNRQRD